MKEHRGEKQIVHIFGSISLYGFLNRWNGSMAADLEKSPKAVGRRALASGGLDGSKHVGK